MKSKRNTIIILSAILIVLLCASALIIYGLNSEKEFNQTTASPAEYVETSIPKSQAIIREDAPKTKTIVAQEPILASKEENKNQGVANPQESSSKTEPERFTEKELTYAATNNTSPDNLIDVYLDEDKAEYRFNSDGVLTSFASPSILAKASDVASEYKKLGIAPLTEAQCVVLAKKHLSATYGKERFEQFELEIIDSYLRGAGGGEGTYSRYEYYTIVFAHKYGKEGFFNGLTASVSIITTDGSVYGSSMRDNSYYEDLDEDYLNSISKETVDAWFAQEVDKLSPGASIDSIIEYKLKKIDGKIFIEAGVFYTGIGRYPTDTILYYPLDI